MNKIINSLYKVILVFMIICFSISLIGATFFYINRSGNYLNPLVLIIGSIIYLLLLIKIYKFLLKKDDKYKKVIVIILLILHFILLFISSQIISSVPKVDLIHILTEINNLNDHGKILNYNYFSVYPNNRFLVIILYVIQKIPLNSDIVFGLFSSLCITTSTFFTYKTVLKVSNIDKALISLIFCVLSPIFYLYVSYYYTDILVLPLASILIYLIVKKDKDNKNNILYGILIGIVAVIGYKIRAVCIFILIAYIIYLLITKKLIDSIKNIIPILLSVIVMIICVNKIDSLFFTNIDKTKEFPMTHWIMMGLNEEKNGYYNHDDYKLTYGVENPKEKVKTNLKVIGERLNKSGVFGISKLMIEKLVVVWGKGDYSYQKYLELVKDYNTSYKYLIEDKNIVINYLLQFSKIVILVLTILSLKKLIKSKKISIIAISLFGAIIFYLIWEVCPRYGLSFLPWLILISSYSYDNLNINLNKFKLYKYIKIILPLMTLILLIIGFNKYTSTDLRENLVAKSTANKVKYISLNKDTVINQELKLNSKFNQIKLQFRKNKNIDNSEIKLELLDEKGNVINKKYIKESDIENKKYTTFKLDKTYKKGKYSIKLSSNIDNNIEAVISYKKEYDYYREGNLKVNKIDEEGDLMFEIICEQQRGIFTYFEYIVISLSTLIIEFTILFRKKEDV